MTTLYNKKTRLNTLSSKEDSLINSVRMLSDITRRDIEKSYSISDKENTEAHYSNRYGWTLRRTIE